MPNIVPLKHCDDPWAVTQRIQLAPEKLVIRELLQNAIENTSQLPLEKRYIRLTGIKLKVGISEVTKLAIINHGPGMDADKLLSILDLAASGEEKQQGIDYNFGIGAKTTGLKASPEGLRYRSCHNGIVSEAIIMRQDNIYGRVKREINNGSYEVYDVTADSLAEGYRLDLDWTEVVLFGKSIHHDTVKYLFNEGDDDVWLAQAINRRFYDLTQYNIKREVSATPTTDHGRTLNGLIDIPTRPGKDQTIALSNGIKIRYGVILSSAGGGTNTRLGYTAHACLVYKNECYDYTDSMTWRRTAPRYGINHAAGQIFVHVLLPDAYQVTNDQYRLHIQRSDSDVMHLEELQEDIYQNRPTWLIDFINSNAPSQSELSTSLQDRLKELQNYLSAYPQLHQTNPNGNIHVQPISTLHKSSNGGVGGKGGGVSVQSAIISINTAKPAGTSANKNKANIPGFEWVNGGTKHLRGDLSERCANYDKVMHHIRLNKQYEPIAKAIEICISRCQHVADQDNVRTVVTRLVEEEIIYRVIKHVLLGLQHYGYANWSASDIDAGLSPEALTIPNSDYRELSDDVRRSVSAIFGK